jgi:hypothetical protein
MKRTTQRIVPMPDSRLTMFLDLSCSELPIPGEQIPFRPSFRNSHEIFMFIKSPIFSGIHDAISDGFKEFVRTFPTGLS